MEPKIRVEQDSVERADETGHWRVRWRIQNIGEAPLKILAARAPHGKFRSGEIALEPALDLAPEEEASIQLALRCNEPPGTDVENAFLILRVQSADRSWLVLARLRVGVKSDGAPSTKTELITSQLMGFSLRQTAE